ncbi:MAG: tryptophan-rich sensory protein [Eubacteriales bacterium]|nr:tryptophan-rich sensory protein [Eubacteriales bacterium]MDD4512457.1 tryptophan-rich sensory protein [Eubacteriales bacterium]
MNGRDALLSFPKNAEVEMRLKALVVNMAIPLAVGALAGVLTMGAMEEYKSVAKPELSPPEIVFPIVWTVLFILMGVSSYLVFVSESGERKKALSIYGVQLFVNFFWPLIYFNAGLYYVAFAWIIALIILAAVMLWRFFRVKRAAGFLNLPYMAWLLFAAYLNIGTAMLN